MSARHVIQNALVMDVSQPEFLVIEYGDDGIARVIGQFFELGDAFKYIHQRVHGKDLDAVSEKRIALVR
jgi:hypothetical protein